MSERRLRGIPAAPGVALGQVVQVHLHAHGKTDVDARGRHQSIGQRAELGPIAPEQTDDEIARLRGAVRQVQERILATLAAAHAEAGSPEAAIFEAHALMLDDPALVEAAEARIRARHEPAPAALRAVADGLIAQIGGLADAYLRERAADVEDVVTQIVRELLGSESGEDLRDLPPGSLVVADELFPSDTAIFDRARVVGMMTQRGGRLGHVAILARALGIPAVLGVANALEQSRSGETAIIDGDRGLVVLSPEPKTLAGFGVRPSTSRAAAYRAGDAPILPAATRDGERVTLRANVGSAAEVEIARANGADGIGLFRTEFLFQEQGRSSPPDEEEQCRAYRRAAQIMAGRRVVIRTLDAGGDKPIPGLCLPREDNPALGIRGIRLLRHRPDLYHTQLRALLRAATAGNVAILFPMVATLDDVRLARQAVERARAELAAGGIAHRADVPLGIMVEVPAAAVIADLLMREVDFFSIGTNDLVQHTLAVDRGHALLSERYGPLDISVVRLIDGVVAAARHAGKPVSVCGELAGDPKAIDALVGLGIRELSMSVPNLSTVAATLRTIDSTEATERMRRQLAGDAAT
jgi:phosphotransferase system enzyme I (PtsI)